MDRDDASDPPSARAVTPSFSASTTASMASTTMTTSHTSHTSHASHATSPTAPTTTPVAPTAAPLLASATSSMTAPLSRSVSQQSAASSTRSSRRSRSVRTSGRSDSRRASSRIPAGTSVSASVSGSSVASGEDNKSLTSFPSFSPKAPSSPHVARATSHSRPRFAGPTTSTASLVETLSRPLPPSSAASPLLLPVTGPSTAIASTSSITAAARSALFEDAPPLLSGSRVIPGELYLTDDAHVARLINKHGAVSLVRQLTEDVAARDAQISALRARAAERERFLRKIILECGLTSLDLETRLRALEQAQVQAQAQAQAAAAAAAAASSTTDSASIHSHNRHVSDLVSDAMSDDNSLHQGSSDYYYNDATIRAAAGKAANANATGGSSSSNTGTTRGWKDFLWGGTAKKSTPRPSLPNDSTKSTNNAISKDGKPSVGVNQTVVRSSSDGRRRTITEDLFDPLPPAASLRNDGRSVSRASSISSARTGHSVHSTSRKPSLASLALRLVGAGGNDNKGDSGSPSQSATATPATSAAASLRATSGGSPATNASTSASTSSATAGPAVSRKLGMGPNGRPLSTSTIGRSGRMSSLSNASIGSGVNGTGAGPRSLMSMRRTNSSAVLNRGTAPQNIAAAGGLNINNMNNTMTAHERWGEMLESSPSNTSGDGLAMRRTAYFPVEMDTILPLDVQPPTLTHMYNHYNSSGHLIDRFGFIYDQRRKKRQREAAQVARHIKHGSRHSETLGRPGRRAVKDNLDEPSTQEDTAKDTEPASPTASFDDSVREVVVAAATPADTVATAAASGPAKRWQDYLKIATFPTELLSHTPAMSDARIEVIAESETAASSASGGLTVTVPTPLDEAGPKSPGFITSNGKGRGFAPPSTGAMAAPTTSTTTTATTMADTASMTGSTTASLHSDSQSQLTDALEQGLPPLPQSTEQKAKAQRDKMSASSSSSSLSLSNPKTTTSRTNSSATLVIKEDAEPVRLLLQQLSELHDNLQKDRTVRWNEFLRKVRAERRREGELAANATSSAASVTDPRFLRATAIMPEARLADGELIGVAGLGNKGKLGRAKWNEFRALVLGGIPVVLRAKVWAECTGATSLRVPGAYDDLVAGRDGSGSGSNGDNGFNGYEDRADVVAQIQADIHRTLTDNIFFREGPGTAKLNEVLLAYARRNPTVGYCQGMNLIAASLLLVTPSAEDAFWLLASIIETILPTGYYDHSLAASRADQQVLRAYVADVLPRLSAHFDALSIDLETMTFQWFLSVFTDCLSAEALFRVWDVVFCLGDGSVFLFQVALALLKLNEAALLRCETPAEIYTYINHQMTNHAISIDGLIQASEALRKLVRREDVEARRATAMDAERALVAARAEAGRERAAARQEKEREKERQKKAEEAKQKQPALTDQPDQPDQPDQLDQPEQEQQSAAAGGSDGAPDAVAAS